MLRKTHLLPTLPHCCRSSEMCWPESFAFKARSCGRADHAPAVVLGVPT